MSTFINWVLTLTDKKLFNRVLIYPVKNYRRGADDLQAFMADRGDDGHEIGDADACPMSRS